MSWDLKEAVAYYRRQGAPGDQNALRNLLTEVQAEQGGAIQQYVLPVIAGELGVKESFLAAIIRRIPSLRIADRHLLEICGGPNCPRRKDLMTLVERLYGKNPTGFTLRQVGCMRQCGKGPNIRWDGKIYNGADEALIRSLIEQG